MFHHLKRGGSDWIRKSINGKRLCVLPAELYVMLEVYTRRRLITGVCEEDAWIWLQWVMDGATWRRWSRESRAAVIIPNNVFISSYS